MFPNNFTFLVLTASLFLIILEIVSSKDNQVRIISGKIFGKKNRIIKWENNVEGVNYLEGWLTQPVDHANISSNNWQQRYCFLLNANSSNNGPILIYVSGETEMDPKWLVLGEMAEHSLDLGSPALFVLEHRFYGKSMPLKDATIQSLKYLTMHQALNDLAKFVIHIKKTYNFENNKVVLYGGSYAGTLVAYFRQIYPHLADVGISSSAPIHFRFDYYEYLDLTASAFKKTSPKCLQILRDGMNQLEERIRRTHYQCSYLHYFGNANRQPCYADMEPLKLCSPLNVRKILDIQSLNSYITQVFIFFAQYNTTLEPGVNLDSICKAIESDNEDMGGYDAFAKILGEMIKYLYDSDCMDYSMDSYCNYFSKTGLKDDAVVSGVRQWVWQTCSDFASFPSTNSPHHPFGNSVPPSFFVQQCRCAFGDMFKSEAHIQSLVMKHLREFGGLSTPRPFVIFTHGENDPVAGLGHKLMPLSSQNTNELIIIKGGSHCDDLSPYNDTDSLSLINARKKTLNLIKKWLLA